MAMIVTFKILAGMLVVTAGSGLLINSIVHIARSFKIKEYLVVFLIIGFAVAIPEFALGYYSSLYGFPEIAFANTIGTAIVSLTLVAGLIALFKKEFSTKSFFQVHDYTHLSLTIVLLILLAMDGVLSTTEGYILILAFLYYLWHLFEVRKQFSLQIKVSKKYLFKHLIVVILATLSIFFSADYTITSLIDFNSSSKISLFFLTAVILSSIGAIPELIFEMNQIKRNKNYLTYGDLFTSVVVNSSLIIGIIAIINPISFEVNNLVRFSTFFLVLILILFNFLIKSKNKLDWKEGITLVFMYVMFIVFGLIVNNFAI